MTAPVIDPEKQKVYRPVPTAYKFHMDNSFVRAIMGPIGSGKSVAMAMEVMLRARAQAPDGNGVRRTRWAVIRNTYPELKTTTLKTWTEWFDLYRCPITYTAPITGRARFPLPDGTRVDAEIVFLAVNQPKDIKRLLSLELTGAWLNEARELPKSVIDMVTGRVGRFPPKAVVPITWTGVIMDSNPPDTDHWWYRLSEEEKPAGWNFYKQPPALLFRNKQFEANAGQGDFPPAENVNNQQLGYNYWLQQLPGKDMEWIRVYIFGQYGNVFEGRPVYDGLYHDAIHVSSSPLGVYKGLPLILGWDFGMTPACVVSQLTPRGCMNVIREVVCERGGLKQFAQQAVLPLLANEFPDLTLQSWTDPAGAQSSQVDEQTCIDLLLNLGIPSQIAPTNKFLPRREAVATFLTRLVDGKPGFQLDPSCKMLRRGFQGGYKFSRVQVTGEERFHDMPTKNQFSHPHDALQYNCMGALHGQMIGLDAQRPSIPQVGVPFL